MDEREEQLKLPSGLSEELRALYAGPGFPGGRNEEILAAARQAGGAGVPVRQQQIGAWRGRRFVGRHRRGIGWGMGIAAAVALAAGICWQQYGPMDAAYVRTGDIRDAFYVARQLKVHRTVETTWDVNKDGVVDARDVQVLAMAAVRVEGAGMGGPERGATP